MVRTGCQGGYGLVLHLAHRELQLNLAVRFNGKPIDVHILPAAQTALYPNGQNIVYKIQYLGRFRCVIAFLLRHHLIGIVQHGKRNRSWQRRIIR
ncbi:MAG: hypothetical protein BWY71_01486 [Planctomycetes bacterium ADurb.Bin412]|nr:MAG: hypothetical protein BWY71_01486 [Planctomycetes bacterium ADurb.Bin412]